MRPCHVILSQSPRATEFREKRDIMLRYRVQRQFMIEPKIEIGFYGILPKIIQFDWHWLLRSISDKDNPSLSGGHIDFQFKANLLSVSYRTENFNKLRID